MTRIIYRHIVKDEFVAVAEANTESEARDLIGPLPEGCEEIVEVFNDR